MPSPPLAGLARVYVAAVIACGFWVVSYSIYRLVAEPIGYQWLVLAALTLISGSATVRLPSVPASISISETFVFTAVLLYGPAAGTLTVALDGLVISFWLSKKRREPYRALFNMSAPAVSAWCSSQLFFWVAGIAPLVQSEATLNRILPALLLFAATYFALNSWLIAFAISAETGQPASTVWSDNFVWLSLNYFCGASVAVLLVAYTREIDLRYVAVIVPLLLVLYFTFKNSMARVEDANKHVEQVNRLYLSTIETLAMAVDAKDQVTHGHIRRVQRYAVGLARKIGVRDEALIKAIEAAALLHDMGKLAVPEHILNKPGKLTVAEFEKMKLHASVGADMLSSIEFPYPVVPIVRHHHESWDGSGYPDGLKGTYIPIGARILSVVDCFDALTSDRPYRPRLSEEDALKILTERSGSMYDPLIIEAFKQLQLEMGSALREDAPRFEVANRPIIVCNQQSASKVAALRHELVLSEFFNEDAANELSALLCRQFDLTQADLLVLFHYDPSSDEIVSSLTIGASSTGLLGMRIPMGQRLSGWVASNQQSILNSDAALDLGECGASIRPPLRSCLSLPISTQKRLLGVVSLYSRQEAAFTTAHLGIASGVVSLVAPLLAARLNSDIVSA